MPGKFAIILLVLLAFGASARAASGPAVVLDIDGPIGPATSDYVTRGLERAQEQGADLVILRMDTPGGLDTAMRSIIQDILAAPMPVVGFVAPSGARAASAGTYILYASHVAAMAPGTNLGAATPVQIGGPGAPAPGAPDEAGEEGAGEEEAGEDGAAPAPKPGLEQKMVNDAVAYIRGLAELRGRNADWAETAVREAASLPAGEALDKNVIDLIAADVPDLLAALDGRTVTVGGQTRTFQTAGIEVVTIEPDWRTELLGIITNPNVAFILMMIGLYGLIFEFSNPGIVVPGVIGTISLLLALYAFQVLPINYAGVALILVGLGLMLGEAFVPSFGALGLGGIAAFVVGAVLLMDTEAPGFQLSWLVIVPFAIVSAGLFMVVFAMLLRSHRRAVVSGPEQMVGSVGDVIDWSGQQGQVRVHGEIWSARAGRPIRPGQPVRVAGRDGLVLIVEPAERE